jgi:hypothetical protein
MTAPHLITEAEAAALIRVSPRTLRDLRSRGMIRYIRPSPRKVFYTAEDCAEYLAKQTRQDTAPCQSTNPPKARTGNTTSSTKVVAITAQLAARQSGMHNGSKPKCGGKPR